MTHLDVAGPAGATDDEAVLGRLSTLDRFLPLWIALAMGSKCGSWWVWCTSRSGCAGG